MYYSELICTLKRYNILKRTLFTNPKIMANFFLFSFVYHLNTKEDAFHATLSQRLPVCILCSREERIDFGISGG